MPKQKTRKSILKRFRVTKSGKVLCRHGESRHLRSKKSKKRQRRHKRTKVLKGRIAKKIKKLL